jgi:succinate dehydrogenase / fumarate reductase cytochrome b subunit
VAIFLGVAILLALLDSSLESQDSFNTVKEHLNNNLLLKLVVWATLCGFIYHTCAGVKHLIMDLGFGETLEGGQKGATAVFVVAPILMVLAGVWIW